MKLLLAEDERELSRPLVTILEHSKYEVDAVYDGLEAYNKITKNTYDLIILDIMMPYKSGLEVLEMIRSEGNNTPVLMLTAKAESEDKIAGLDSGADDYLTKPFVMGELLARVRALTRRSERNTATVLEYNGIKLDKSNFELSGNDTAFVLANREFAIMEMLMTNGGKSVPSSSLIERVWRNGETADNDILDMYVSFVRNKVRAIDEHTDIKHTGDSYTLEAV